VRSADRTFVAVEPFVCVPLLSDFPVEVPFRALVTAALWREEAEEPFVARGGLDGDFLTSFSPRIFRGLGRLRFGSGRAGRPRSVSSSAPKGSGEDDRRRRRLGFGSGDCMLLCCAVGRLGKFS